MARKTDPQVEAANEIYKVAREQADIEISQLRGDIEAIREESQAIGILKKIEYDNAHNEMLKYVVLARLRQSKDYKNGGLTWAEFCDEVVGENRRTVDEKILDIKPLADNFGRIFAQISGVSFSKIRYLGKSIGQESAQIEDGMLIVDDQRIPLTPEHKDEIEALIDSLKDTARQEREEAATALRTKDRLLESKEQVINKQEKEISRHEARANSQGFAPGEEAFLQQMENSRISMDGFIRMYEYDPADSVRSDLTPRMKAALLSNLAYFRHVIIATHEAAKDLLQESEHDWDPDAELAAFEAEQKKRKSTLSDAEIAGMSEGIFLED